MAGGRRALLAATNSEAAPWTPAQITTALWLDAADASTVTTVSGAVSQWNDKSGNARHVSQATAASRPTLSAASFGGKDAILFDGSNDFMQGAASITTGTYAGDFNVYWVGTRSSVGGAVIVERNSALVGLSQWIYINPGYISSDGQSGSSNHTISDTTFNKLAAGGGIVAHFHLPGQRDILYLNGTQETVTAGTASNITGSTTSFRIGSREAAVGGYWNGRLCEIIVSLSSQTTAVRQQIEGYLAWKWSLTSSLPADHPYKSVAP